MRPIDADALLERVDEERKYLLARGQTGAEHILVHNFRNLIDIAPTIFNCNTCKNVGNERECADCYDYSNYIRYGKRSQDENINLKSAKEVIAKFRGYLDNDMIARIQIALEKESEKENEIG